MLNEYTMDNFLNAFIEHVQTFTKCEAELNLDLYLKIIDIKESLESLGFLYEKLAKNVEYLDEMHPAGYHSLSARNLEILKLSNDIADKENKLPKQIRDYLLDKQSKPMFGNRSSLFEGHTDRSHLDIFPKCLRLSGMLNRLNDFIITWNRNNKRNKVKSHP